MILESELLLEILTKLVSLSTKNDLIRITEMRFVPPFFTSATEGGRRLFFRHCLCDCEQDLSKKKTMDTVGRNLVERLLCDKDEFILVW